MQGMQYGKKCFPFNTTLKLGTHYSFFLCNTAGRSRCTNHLMLVQRFPPPEDSDQRSTLFAESADWGAVSGLFSRMHVRQKLVKRPASVRQTDMHTGRMSDIFFFFLTRLFFPTFGPCVRDLPLFCSLGPWDCA